MNGRHVTSAPAQIPAPAQVGFGQRVRMRRRLRYLRALREVQLRDIGGFLLEQHRVGTERPELVQAKLRSATGTDTELRALEEALREPLGPTELRVPGIGGACPRCASVHGSLDHFCASCGQDLRAPQPAADERRSRPR